MQVKITVTKDGRVGLTIHPECRAESYVLGEFEKQANSPDEQPFVLKQGTADGAVECLILGSHKLKDLHGRN